MTCYSPSRHYLSAGLVALAFAALSGWIAAIQWAPAYIAAVLFVASAAILLILALQPPIQISDHHLTIGKRAIVWSDIERVDRTSWISPLVVYLTLAEGKRVLLVYSGDVEGGKSLLRQIRRYARFSLIDGIPYRQFWGELLPSVGEPKQLQSPRYRLLRPEDEAEVERLFQRLKTVGNLDPKNSGDEK